MIRETSHVSVTACVVLILLASGEEAYGQACVQNCSMAKPFMNTSACSWYTESTEALWLPPTYAQGARCACLMNNTEPTSEVASAACVRGQVHLGHLGDVWFNASEKALLARLRATECNGTACSAAYIDAINNTDTVPRIVALHASAYKSCCCPLHPAPLLDWWLIVLFGEAFEWKPVCDATYLFMTWFGPCGCEGW